MADQDINTLSVSPHAQGANELYALIAAACRDERLAQRELYNRFANFIYDIISRYSDDEPVIEDIQSDAFYRIFVNLHQYRFEGAFEGWMRRVTINAVAAYFRRQRPANARLPEDAEEITVSIDASAPGNLAYRELLAFIYELPPLHRAVFNLFIFENYSHKEIAGLLEISGNNSRWHLNDARRRLKEKVIANTRK